LFGLWYLTPPNNISVISWRSVLLEEKTGIPGENRRPVTSHCQTLLRLAMNGIQTLMK